MKKKDHGSTPDLFTAAGVDYPKRTRTRKQPGPTDFVSWIEEIFRCRCVAEFRFHTTRHWRFDYALPSYSIAVEVEGGIWSNGRHVRPAGYLGDMEKYNMAAVMGWIVIRTTPQELFTDKVRGLIRTAICHRKRSQSLFSASSQ